MAHYAVTAIGTDRPGIVAGLAGALERMRGNLEDVSSTILRGQFAMMFVVEVGEDEERVRGALERAAEPLGVQVHVAEVAAEVPERPRATHVLSAYGADRPGIVARLARLLADREVNITDLSCRLTGAEQPIYAMVAEVAVPEDVDADVLEADVRTVADDLGIDVSFRSLEADAL